MFAPGRKIGSTRIIHVVQGKLEMAATIEA